MTQIFFKKKPTLLEKTVPAIGSHLPNFSYTTSNLSDQNLSFHQGKPLILWFVPSLDTGTCILSTKKLNDHLKKHPQVKALILSMDLPFAQGRLCGLEHLDHVEVGSLFRHQQTLVNLGLMIADGPLQGLSARCVILLNSHHHVAYLELATEISEELNYTKLYHHLDHGF